MATEQTRMEHLIALTAREDRAAFEELYQLASPLLFGLLLERTPNKKTAEAALERVFMVIWAEAKSYQPGLFSPRLWLIMLARDAAHYVQAAKGEPVTVLAQLFLRLRGQQPLELRLAAASDASHLKSSLAQLPSQEASAIRRLYLQGGSYADLAKTRKISELDARAWLRGALFDLHQRMTK
ncbi:MAG: hypothetical protein AAGD04_00840 [Pseudomonadota bacterium]